MNENNIFSPRRFGALCMKHILEGRRDLIAAGALAIIYMLASMFSDTFYNTADQVKTVWFYIIFCVAGLVVASLSFRNHSTAPQRLSAIMTPASQFEKYLIAVLSALPLYIAVSFICLVIGDSVGTLIMRLFMPAEANISFYDYSYLIQIWPEDTTDVITILTIALAIQSYFFLGSILFKRLSLVKTLLSMTAIWLLLIACAAITIKIFFNPATLVTKPAFFDWFAHYNWLPEAGFIFIAMFNYFIAWLRLRESEIINRW